MSGPVYPPDVTDSLGLEWPPLTVGDAVDVSDYAVYICHAKYFGVQIQNEILNNTYSQVAGRTWAHSYTCIAGLAIGDPVYLSANDTATKALATDTTKNQVIGFVKFKGTPGAASVPTATNCYLQNYLIVTGLSGGTAGATVYLTDAGGYSATPGTISTPVGRWINTTTAALSAAPVPSQATNSNLGTILLPEVDLKTTATFVFPLPTGYNGININEAGIILSTLSAGTYTAQPTIEYGITGTNAKYLAAVATTLLSAVGKRERYTTLLADDRETVPNFTITSAATGTATNIKGRPYIIGVLS